MSKLICSVYRSPKKEGMYLYVAKQQALSRVPEALLKMFGAPELAMTLVLTADKKLARITAEKVMEQIDSQGFYLQMADVKEDYMQEINLHNSKLYQQ